MARFLPCITNLLTCASQNEKLYVNGEAQSLNTD